MMYLLPLLFSVALARPQTETKRIDMTPTCPLEMSVGDLRYDEDIYPEVVKFLNRLMEETLNVPEECDDLLYAHLLMGQIKYVTSQHFDTLEKSLLSSDVKMNIMMKLDELNNAQDLSKNQLRKFLNLRRRQQRSEDSTRIFDGNILVSEDEQVELAEVVHPVSPGFQSSRPLSRDTHAISRIMLYLEEGIRGLRTDYFGQFEQDFAFMDAHFTEPVAFEDLFVAMEEFPTLPDYKKMTFGQILIKADYMLRPFFDSITRSLRHDSCAASREDLTTLRQELTAHRDWVAGLSADDLMMSFPQEISDLLPTEMLQYILMDIHEKLIDTSVFDNALRDLKEDFVGVGEHRLRFSFYAGGIFGREMMEAMTTQNGVWEYLTENQEQLYPLVDSMLELDREGATQKLMTLLQTIAVYVHHLEVPVDRLPDLFDHIVTTM